MEEEESERGAREIRDAIDILVHKQAF
jgi:hypothetical protein